MADSDCDFLGDRFRYFDVQPLVWMIERVETTNPFWKTSPSASWADQEYLLGN